VPLPKINIETSKKLFRAKPLRREGSVLESFCDFASLREPHFRNYSEGSYSNLKCINILRRSRDGSPWSKRSASKEAVASRRFWWNQDEHPCTNTTLFN